VSCAILSPANFISLAIMTNFERAKTMGSGFIVFRMHENVLPCTIGKEFLNGQDYGLRMYCFFVCTKTTGSGCVVFFVCMNGI
jgi:hypothetical protein